MPSLSSRENHVDQRVRVLLPLVPHQARASIPNMRFISRDMGWSTRRHVIGLHSHAPLPTEDSRLGKGQRSALGSPVTMGAYQVWAVCETRVFPFTSLAVLRSPFRASSCSCHFVPYTLSNPSRSLQLFEQTETHSHLHTIALRLVLIARRVHHLNNTRNTHLQHFNHASLLFPGRSCSLVHSPCFCSDTLLV
jgi:hypothetical protein